MQAHVSEV